MAKLILLIALIGLSFAQESGARYLIITHDSYYDAIKPLAEWKTQKGLKAKIVKLSEIGTDSVSIRNYIVNAYNTWPIKPEYLLLVGNKLQIPFPYFNYQGTISHCDNYYTNIVGDFHNEILPGRLWVNNVNEARTVIAKILGYEKDPFMAEPLWFQKGTTIVHEDEYPPYSDSVYWADTWYAHQLMINAGFSHVDTFSQNLGHNSSDVVNAINDGRSYILYRGVGYVTWDVPFDNIDTSQMNNGFKLSIIISATCETIEGIGYEWLNAGTPEQPKGTVGFYGTTTALMNAAELRSALAKGTLRSIFCDSFSTLGRAAESGRLEYYRLFGNTLEYNSWTCLGDPEMAVWTTIPKTIQLSHSPEVWKDTLTVQVKCNALPVESALVCVMARHDSSVYHYKRTNNNGIVKFVDNLYPRDTALITVTGRNLLTSVDTVIGCYVGGPYMISKSYLILDTINGNGNFQPNNGEEIELAVWVWNIGDSTAYNVSGVIQKAEPDNYYQLNDTIKYFGDITPMDSAFTTQDGFNVIIDPNCPDSHLIKLKLTLKDAVDSVWTSYLGFLVYSPRPYIVYQSHMILDTIGGNGNYQVNPDEDIELAVWIKNIGDSLGENVYGIIQKVESDPYFSLDDTIKYFGTILPMDSAWTSADGYNVYVDSSCPDQHQIKLRLKIEDSLDSTWIYNITLINYAPELVYRNYYFADSVKYILHGDTANLSVYIKNIGSEVAQNTNGHLISADTFLTILDGDAQFGSIPPDSIGSNTTNQFIIVANQYTPPCYSLSLMVALDAGVYRDTINFNIYIGKRDYLVWDPDPNHSSGFVIHSKLFSLGYLGEYRTTFPYDYTNIYKTFFVCVGMYPTRYILYDTSCAIPEIVHYLDAGGRMYLEGGDVWYFDPSMGGHNFCPLFNITPISNNSGYFTGVLGIDNTFTQGMSFRYSGESSSIDRINPAGNGVMVFKNRFNDYSCGVAANNRTIGISIEFGGFVDSIPPSTKTILIDSIMHYFGIMPSGEVKEEKGYSFNIAQPFLKILPNPFSKITNIKFQIPSLIKSGTKSQTSLKIYDTSGRLVKTFNLKSSISNLISVITWHGDDDLGRHIPAGVYFIRLEAGSTNLIRKVVFLR